MRKKRYKDVVSSFLWLKCGIKCFFIIIIIFFFKLQAPPPKAVKKATPAKGTKVGNGTPAKKAESEDDDSGK